MLFYKQRTLVYEKPKKSLSPAPIFDPIHLIQDVDSVYSPNNFLESLFQNFRVESRAFAPLSHFSLHHLAASKKNQPNILVFFIFLKIVGFADNSSQSTKLRFFFTSRASAGRWKSIRIFVKKGTAAICVNPN